MTFKQWMKALDDLTWNMVGMSIHDLPDCCYRDWYDDKVSPTEAVERAICAAM